MRFSNSFLEEIRDRVSISDVVGRRVTWDRKKTNAARGDYWACCPFHGEKSPSFHCENRKGRYHCFGCGVSGDHFRFLTDLDGMSFPEAVRQIADMAGVAMPQPDAQAERRERERASLHDVMEMAASFFEERLQAAQGARARAYLRDRGLSGRTVETFRLGYAPDSRNALKEHLAAKGVEREQMEACGLVVHENVPVSYDRFRDRIMFPILSAREKVIAFGGRALSVDAPAKYLNSNETELFRKSEVLYNFARARRAIQPGGDSGAVPVVVVEGYMDVIALHQAGIGNAVAPLGTALTESQLELLWRLSPQPVLCFDGDGAGLRAANRAADLALPHIKPDRSVGFALLPDGKDPDDLVRHEGRGPFDRVLAHVKPLAAMIWERETASVNFDTPEKRAQLESRLRQVVTSIGDESVRRFYQQHMRERLHAFFQPQFQRADAGSRDFRREAAGHGQRRGQGRGGETAAGVSERLSRSGLVQGYRATPALRESVLALTIVNHPQLLMEDYDEIAVIDYENPDLQRLWPRLLTHAAESFATTEHREFDRPELDRQDVAARLRAEGFAALLTAMDRQVRNARLWTATAEAALEDAREGYVQALSLHQRSKALRWQKIELEREIADATEAEDAESLERRMRALAEVQLEIARLENQEAIIDGFGVMSGRIKGAALGRSG